MKAVALRIGALARLILTDGLRRRALLGLFFLVLLVELCGLFFSNFVPRDIGRVLVDYSVTVGWAAGMVYLFFHAVQVMGWGDDRRVIQLLLSHPISRGEYVFGVFCGLLLLLLFLNVVLGAGSYAILYFVKTTVGESYFAQLKVIEYALAWSGVFAIELVVLAAIVLFSGLVRGSFSVLLLSMSYYLICNGLPVALEFFKDESSASKSFLVALTFLFPNFDRWDYKGFVVATDSFPAIGSLGIDFLYVVLYCFLVLVLAAKVYSLRDIK